MSWFYGVINQTGIRFVMFSLLTPFTNVGLWNLTNKLYLFTYLAKDITMSIVEIIWLISNNMSMFFWIWSINFLSNDSDWNTNACSDYFSLLFRELNICVEKVTILPLPEIWTKFSSILWVTLCKSTVSWTLMKYPRLSLNIKCIS